MKSNFGLPAHRGTDSPIERRKRLGQYYTGTALGRLLAALGKAHQATSVLDPMAGSGDLLASCLEIDSKPKILAGIEIDPLARDKCASRLPSAYCLLGNAFDPQTIAQLPTQAWDLVIANPPYVRYQSLSANSNSPFDPPSSAQVRRGLVKVLDSLSTLDQEDKRLFSHLASSYSGLSDLAVPSWILCAAMVQPEGRIALVVPESWLNRDYATVVQYLLLRWFDLEFIVEDEHASWFEDAQVKTTLIVAKRVRRRELDPQTLNGATYSHIGIAASAGNKGSPIGKLISSTQNAEVGFAEQAREWLNQNTTSTTGMVQVRPVLLSQAYTNLVASASRQKWFTALEESRILSESIYIPHVIHDWISKHALTLSFISFETQGISVGQGLRTGANHFFYASGHRCGSDVKLSFSGPLEGLQATVPLGIARPALRRQNELPRGFVLSPESTQSWIVDLRKYALPEDLETKDLFSAPYSTMPEDMAHVVRAAMQANFGTQSEEKRIWDLSAVSPNIRPASRGAHQRYWYMLPDFASRHLPDVLLARVNSETPKAYQNEGRECLIDANFSTLWINKESQWSAASLLAFMNSTWVRALIELSSTVMGGGALKVEATHLRRLPVPLLTTEQLGKLSKLGKNLASGASEQTTTSAIDEVLAQAMRCSSDGISDLQSIVRKARKQRSNRKNLRKE